MGVLQETGGRGMKEIDQNNLDTAIALGDAVCNELGICCETRGRSYSRSIRNLKK